MGNELNYVSSLCDLSKIAKEKLPEIKRKFEDAKKLVKLNAEAWWKKLNELSITELQGPNSGRPVLQLELIGDEGAMSVGYRGNDYVWNFDESKPWRKFLAAKEKEIKTKLRNLPGGEYTVKVYIKKNTPPNKNLAIELDFYNALNFDYSHHLESINEEIRAELC